MLRKYVFIIMVFFLPICTYALDSNGLKNIKKENAIKLDVEKILSADKSEGANAVQGIEVTDKYIIITQSMKNEKDKNAIMIYDKKSLKYIKTLQYYIGHGNDVAYNSKTNELLFVQSKDGKILLTVLDSNTLKFKRNQELSFSKGAYAISYNERLDQYYFASGNKGYITNSNYKVIGNFDLDLNQTRQSFEYNDGYLYHSTYDAGKVTPYQSLYDGVFNANDGIIYVFDENGKYNTSLYIPAIGGMNTELEGIGIDTSGKVYILFNNWSNGKFELYTPRYSNDSVINIDIPINTDLDKYSDYSFKADLICNNEYIKEVVSRDLHYNFSIQKTGLQSAKYVLKQKDIHLNDLNLDSEITITTKSKYSFAYNKVITSYQLNKNGFNNNSVNNNQVVLNDNVSESDDVYEPTFIINVPDTLSDYNNIIVIIGSFLIALAYLFIKINKKYD